MTGPGINVQLQGLTLADVPDLRRFTGGALVIADWPEQVSDTLAVLGAAGVPVTMWRFTQDPLKWPGWPGNYIKRCEWAVLHNEPDIEGPPPVWYQARADLWRIVGGNLVEPAWSDESKRQNYWGELHQALSAHVYPLGRGAAHPAPARAPPAGGGPPRGHPGWASARRA